MILDNCQMLYCVIKTSEIVISDNVISTICFRWQTKSLSKVGGFNMRVQFLYYHTRAKLPALSHMELCRLLAAIALKITTASIKPIKVNKVHWMKFPYAFLAKHPLIMFLRMQSTWIHGWKSIRTELLVLLMNKCSSPGVDRGKVSWRGSERGLLVRLKCC